MFYCYCDKENNAEFPYKVGHYNPKGKFLLLACWRDLRNAIADVSRLNGGTKVVVQEKSSGPPVGGWYPDPC
jgi:hypothetical protein